MPRHPGNSRTHNPAYERLRTLRLAVQLRAEQVKLRRLEWDTQKLALPHLTPLPGDGELQVRKPLTDKDIPRPRPAVMPEYSPDMPHELYEVLINLYMDDVRYEERRDPYNHLASITAQTLLDAKQEREDARREKLREREKKARERQEVRKAKEAAKSAS